MRARSVRVLFGIVLAASFGMALGTAPAAAGGGFCRGFPVTAASTNRAFMANYCFAPTIVRIDVGQAVTWTNKDGSPHVVVGANASWGSYDEIVAGGHTTVRFDKAGVYPYFCFIHPGMIGAVVVGDGGPTSSTLGAALPVVASPESSLAPAGATSAAKVGSAVRQHGDSAIAWKLATFVGFGLLLLGGMAMLGRRLAARPEATKA